MPVSSHIHKNRTRFLLLRPFHRLVLAEALALEIERSSLRADDHRCRTVLPPHRGGRLFRSKVSTCVRPFVVLKLLRDATHARTARHTTPRPTRPAGTDMPEPMGAEIGN